MHTSSQILNFNPVKRLEFYAVTGGVPKYIETLSPDKTLWDNISTNILSKNSYLYNEPRFILNEEITETLNYFSILKTIAEVEHKIGNMEDTDYVLNKIKKDFTSFAGLAYERACLERIPVLSKTGALPFKPEKWGKWWTRNEEIDVVALNTGTKEIILGECKWSEKPVGIPCLQTAIMSQRYVFIKGTVSVFRP